MSDLTPPRAVVMICRLGTQAVGEVVPHGSRVVYNEDEAKTEPVQLLFTVRPPYTVRAMRFEPQAVRARKDAVNRRIYAAMLGLAGETSPTIEKMRGEMQLAGASGATAPVESTADELPPHHRIQFGEPDTRTPARQRVFRRGVP